MRDGYDRLSMEGVAAAAGVGKATVYRRWGSKAELVIDAMATLKPAIDTIDTGSLDGDIELMIVASCSPHSHRLLQVMVSICSALPREPELLEAFKTRFTEPRIARITEMLIPRPAPRRARPRRRRGHGREPRAVTHAAASTHDRPTGRSRLRRTGRGQRAAPGTGTPRTTISTTDTEDTP